MLAALSSAILAPAAPALAGEALLGVTQGPTPEMVRIDAAAPQSPAARAPVAGLMAGEVVEAIEQRPATGQVLVLTSVDRVLLLDPATGAVTQPGPPLEPALFAAGQAGEQQGPAALQPPPDRSRRPAQLAGCLVLRAPFQAAQDHRQPVHLRQPLDLLVEQGKQLAGGEQAITHRLSRL